MNYCSIERQVDIEPIYLFVWIHAGKPTLVARLAALFGNFLHFLLGSVSEVAGVGILRHDGWMSIETVLWRMFSVCM